MCLELTFPYHETEQKTYAQTYSTNAKREGQTLVIALPYFSALICKFAPQIATSILAFIPLILYLNFL